MSIVRENLMSREGYSPYCGDMNCRAGMPRTRFVSGQFQCSCGWRSGFEPEFIEAYRAKWAKPTPKPLSPRGPVIDTTRETKREKRRRLADIPREKQVICDECGRLSKRALSFRNDFEMPKRLCSSCCYTHDNHPDVIREREHIEAMDASERDDF